ncbi:hypothetical protein MNBD_IGNAVI01-2273 [hydrothermal vent metagenome]|uniref:Calcineurin-like phosphoesterase domain-containing protein n=1 Tax=hydrothermal vent metagenome TaxID=652676 RepID=A0A3B1DLD4_9ZZZZ
MMPSTKNRITAIIVLLLLFFTGCNTTSHVYPDGDFKILVISDIHITNSKSKDERLLKRIEKINNGKYPGVDFVVTTGDNVSSIYDHYYPDSLDKSYNRLERFVEIMSRLKAPKYFVLGNHEYKIDRERDSDAPYTKDEIVQLTKIWSDLTGFQPYYSFVHKGWKFIILNSMSGRYMNRFFDEDQLKWLEQELSDDLPTLLFFHHPLITDSFRIWCGLRGLMNVNIEPEFYMMLNKHKNQIKGIFVGHGHRWVHDKIFGTIEVYEAASFGDDESSPFYIVGFDNVTQTISVAQSPIEFVNTKVN